MPGEEIHVVASSIAKDISEHGLILIIGSGMSANLGRVKPVPSHRKEGKAQNTAEGALFFPVRSLYRRLCEWPATAIVTTNYDGLLEQALSEIGRQVSTVDTPWDFNNATEKAGQVIVRLHGALKSSDESIADNDLSTWDFGHRLMERLNELYPFEVRIFIGWKAGDPLLDLATERSNSNVARRVFLNLSKKGIPKGISLRFDDALSLGPKETDTLSRAIASVASQDLLVNSSGFIKSALERYRQYVKRRVRLGWTVDEKTSVVPNRAPLRVVLDEQSGFQFHNFAKRESLIHSQPWSDLLAELTTHGLVVIVGDPGSGKTTVLQALVDRLANQRSAEGYLPLFLQAADLTDSKVTKYSEFLNRIEARSGIVGLSTAIRSFLRENPCVLVVDGLDELKKSELRAVIQACRDFTAAFPSSRCIVSSRWQGYSHDIDTGQGDLIAHLCPLRDEDITNFVRCSLDNSTEAHSLLTALQCHNELWELATRPLFLGMLVYVWKHNRSVPLRLWDLYQHGAELLLTRWDWERAVFRENRFSSLTHSRALASCAIALFCDGSFSVDTETLVDSLRADEILNRLDGTDLLALIEECETRTGLLRRISSDRWAFVHRAFAEYFAAEFVVSAKTDSLTKVIMKSKSVENWVPILALAASSSVSARKHVQKVLQSLPLLQHSGVLDTAVTLSKGVAEPGLACH